MTDRSAFRRRLGSGEPVLAPLVLDPLMARLAADAGFEALYLGGGAMGYARAVLEANLSLTEMAHAGLQVTSTCALPLLLDGAAGWGDPMHVRRTVAVAEAAGFAGIEIEDQLLPKRAHHHVGIEHMVPLELMAAKVEQARAARRDPDFLIVARTNAIRASDMDDALRRLEAYDAAGADLLLPGVRTAEDARHVGERLPPRLVVLSRPGGPAAMGMTLADFGAAGFRLVCDPQTALLAQYHAAREVYRGLRSPGGAEAPAGTTWAALGEDIHETIGIEALLDVERATVERDR